MSVSPLVTIGLPVFNRERFVRQAIESLLNQTFRDFQLIISDNASTDSTGKICEEYARKDRRVRYFRNSENIGLSPNFNRVFSLSQSPYLKWSTSDDYWAPTMIERALEIMEADRSIVLCYPKTMLVNQEGGDSQPYEDNLHLVSDNSKERFIQLLSQIGLAHQHTGLIRAESLSRTHLLGDYPGSDVVLLAELTLYGKFFEIPERLYFRRFHEESSSWLRSSQEHQNKFYLSPKSSKVTMNRWRRYLGLLSAVHTAPVGFQDRWSLYCYLGRLMRWERSALVDEVVERFKALVSKLP
jgi:glycosyltransferase involved in cell wall biosynthesis